MTNTTTWLAGVALFTLQSAVLAQEAAPRIVSHAGRTIENAIPPPSGCQRLIGGAGISHDQTSGDLYYLFRCRSEAGKPSAFLRLWRIRILDTKLPGDKAYPARVVSEGVALRITGSVERLAIRSCDIQNEAGAFAVVVGRYKEVPDDMSTKDAVAAWRPRGEALQSLSLQQLGNCPY